MRAGFAQTTLFQHVNPVGMHHSGQAVRDYEGRAAFKKFFQRLLHLRFGNRIERGGRLVKQQNRSVFQNGAGDGKALFLTARKPDAALTDMRFIALR